MPIRNGFTYLNNIWRAMRDGCDANVMAEARGAVEAFLFVGILSSKAEAEGWLARFARCPGHDDEGGRAWCAYCGTLPQEATDDES